jgi:4-aminobutyrate aminotransferase/(S)-3-amino-2-methylpropionate transaminase
MARRRSAVARGPFHGTPIFVDHAHGALITDVDGNVFIDLAAGIGVVNTGHTPAALVNAIKAQADRLLHGSFNVTPYESYVALCEALNAKAPGAFAKKSFLANSGAEAVENAIKIARAHTGRPGVVAFEHAFHGRTFMAMSLTYKEKPYKTGFAPLNGDVHRAPFPYPYHDVSAEQAFKGFTDLVEKVTATKLAAVILEPVQGEGGFLPAPKEFLAKLSSFCAQHGIVVISDEIQCGFGRTGTLFASEQLGFVPDLILTAKGLGGGLPISAVTGRAEIMDAPIEGGIGGTFGGNPVAVASALAVLKTLEDGAFFARAQQLGRSVLKTLQGWKEKYPIIGDVRGLGPMLAFELVRDRASKEPYADGAKALVKLCYERGVVLMTAGSYGNCVRLLFPLVITDEQLAEAFAVVEEGLARLTGINKPERDRPTGRLD